MIRNIVFDMGNVLIRFDGRVSIEQFCADEDDRALLYREIFQSVEWVQRDRGTIEIPNAVASICTRLPHRLHSLVGEIMLHWNDDLHLLPGMEELATRLKAGGYGLYLLSNAGKCFHDYCDRIPALCHFDGKFISADWGLIKPEADIFRAFYSHFGLVPGECFFIDDFPLNIECAQRTGMPGHIYHGDLPALESALHAAGVNL